MKSDRQLQTPPTHALVGYLEKIIVFKSEPTRSISLWDIKYQKSSLCCQNHT